MTSFREAFSKYKQAAAKDLVEGGERKRVPDYLRDIDHWRDLAQAMYIEGVENQKYNTEIYVNGLLERIKELEALNQARSQENKILTEKLDQLKTKAESVGTKIKRYFEIQAHIHSHLNELEKIKNEIPYRKRRFY